MTELQQRLIDHWVKYMPIAPEQIAHSIREYFEMCPFDRDVMKPALEKAWKQMKEKNASNL